MIKFTWKVIRYIQRVCVYKSFNVPWGNNNKNKIWANKQRYLLRTQKVCQQCKTSNNLTVDHIKPIKLGGTDRLSNLQLLCYRCNFCKDNKIKRDRLWTVKNSVISGTYVPSSLSTPSFLTKSVRGI